MPGGSHGHAVCNIEPISGKKSIQLASVHSLVTLTSGAFEPYAFDVGLAIVNFTLTQVVQRRLTAGEISL
jgi:hypothetical protein